MRVRSLAVCGVAVACLTGCPSFTTLGLARPLKKGSTQIVIAPEYENATFVLNGTAFPVTLPQGELAVSYGVSDNFELGAKAWFFGAELNGKFGLIQSPTMDSGMDLAFSPGLSYVGIGAGGGSVNLLTVSLPLQVGLNFGGNQLVLSPKVIDYLLVSGGAGNLVVAGGSVGLALKLGDELRLMPQVTAMYPLLAASGSGAGTTGFQGVLLQGGISLLFGGKYDSPQQALPP